MIPKKLQKGDEIRVISPSLSMEIISDEVKKQAIETLEEMGFSVTFSKNIGEMDDFSSSPIQSRVDDIHAAFADPHVKGILTCIGGNNSNQLLRYLDYQLIKDNPKILCGYSDITALANAIYAKTGLVTYSGPHFSSFGMKQGIEYTKEYFLKCFTANDEIELVPSKEWSDDLWFLDQEKRVFHENEGSVVCNIGEGEGRIIGGHLGTFRLLQGTEYMPSLENTILFLEACNPEGAAIFDRNLQSLIHTPDFSGVKGIVIGRFQKDSGVTTENMMKIIKTKAELNNIPVICNLDFGHTTPIFTFAIGGRGRIKASENGGVVVITEC